MSQNSLQSTIRSVLLVCSLLGMFSQPARAGQPDWHSQFRVRRDWNTDRCT